MTLFSGSLAVLGLLLSQAAAQSSCAGSGDNSIPECDDQTQCYGESTCCFASGSCTNSENNVCEKTFQCDDGPGGCGTTPPFPPADDNTYNSPSRPNQNDDGCRCIKQGPCPSGIRCWGTVTCNSTLCGANVQCCDVDNTCEGVGGMGTGGQIPAGGFCIQNGGNDDNTFKFCGVPDTTTSTSSTTETSTTTSTSTDTTTSTSTSTSTESTTSTSTATETSTTTSTGTDTTTSTSTSTSTESTTSTSTATETSTSTSTTTSTSTATSTTSTTSTTTTTTTETTSTSTETTSTSTVSTTSTSTETATTTSTSTSTTTAGTTTSTSTITETTTTTSTTTETATDAPIVPTPAPTPAPTEAPEGSMPNSESQANGWGMYLPGVQGMIGAWSGTTVENAKTPAVAWVGVPIAGLVAGMFMYVAWNRFERQRQEYQRHLVREVEGAPLVHDDMEGAGHALE